MEKIKFLSLKSYTITRNGSGKKINLNPYMLVEVGEKLYQAKLADGCILMIPENQIEKYRAIFEEKNKKDLT